MKAIKSTLVLLSILLLFSCKEENELEQYKGTYSGEKIIETYYKVEDTVTHSLTSMIKYDTITCSIEVIPDCDKLDIKEFYNNTLIKTWNDFEINNVGDIAYFGVDTAAYGQIAPSSFSCFVSFTPSIPSDTTFYNYHYTLSR